MDASLNSNRKTDTNNFSDQKPAIRPFATGRYMLYNMVGLGLPLLVAVFALPQLIIGLGVAKFGLLTLVWALISYLGLFDFGLGRALTQRIVVLRDAGDSAAIPSLIATAMALLLALGIIAGLVLASFGLTGLGMIKGGGNSVEVQGALHALAFAMPAIIVTTGFRGILEANSAFGIVNLIRIPMGFFTYLGPLVVLLVFGPQLDLIAWVLTVGRIIACVIHGWFALSGVKRAEGRFKIAAVHAIPLCTTGGWMTVSNIISPFMGYIDRFMIGTMVSAAAVAYYVTPNELVTKLWIIPGALTSVLFPLLSQTAGRDCNTAWITLKRSVGWLLITIMPIALILGVFAHEILSGWIGKQFADQSSVILKLLAIGILINCLAHIPLTLIQAFNRPKLVALLHISEFPLFIASLWVGVHYFGVVGAAAVWLGRMTCDAIVLFMIAARVTGQPWSSLWSSRSSVIATIVACAFASSLSTSMWLRIPIVAVSFIPLLIGALRYRKHHNLSFSSLFYQSPG